MSASVEGSVFGARKKYLNVGCFGNHLKGIGGAGAPHEFFLQRREDAGSLTVL